MEKKTKAATESGVLLLLIAGILVALNALGAFGVSKRIDTTKNEKFTLSKGSGNLLRFETRLVLPAHAGSLVKIEFTWFRIRAASGIALNAPANCGLLRKLGNSRRERGLIRKPARRARPETEGECLKRHTGIHHDAETLGMNPGMRGRRSAAFCPLS